MLQQTLHLERMTPDNVPLSTRAPIRPATPRLERITPERAPADNVSGRVLVLIIPADVDLNKRTSRLEASASTWGKELARINSIAPGSVKAVLVASAEDVRQRGAYPEFDLLRVPQSLHQPLDQGKWVVASYRLVSWALQQVAKQYPTHWVTVIHDNTLIVPPNLYCLVQDHHSKLHSTPTMQGMELNTGDTTFVPTSSGLILSPTALQLFAKAARSGNRGSCNSATVDQWHNVNLAVTLSKCFQGLGVVPVKQAAKEHMFHCYGPVRTVRGAQDDWFSNYHLNKFKVRPAKGADCCSAQSVSFHYQEAQEIRVIWDILQHQRNYRVLTMEERKNRWPLQRHVSAYSSVPGSEDHELWHLMLTKLLLRTIDPISGMCKPSE